MNLLPHFFFFKSLFVYSVCVIKKYSKGLLRGRAAVKMPSLELLCFAIAEHIG